MVPVPSTTAPAISGVFETIAADASITAALKIATVHTDPDDATPEINALVNVVADARKHYPNEDDFIVPGDLNADCSYFDKAGPSPLKEGYQWLIGNEADTNVAGTSCTYDRIITTLQTKGNYTGNSGVFKFDLEYDLPMKPKTVSDHYPLWSWFYTGKD